MFLLPHLGNICLLSNCKNTRTRLMDDNDRFCGYKVHVFRVKGRYLVFDESDPLKSYLSSIGKISSSTVKQHILA